jgi:hypothetical protein
MGQAVKGEPRKGAAVHGCCRECGCTQGNPCTGAEYGDVCRWSDETRTLCTMCAEGRTMEGVPTTAVGWAVAIAEARAYQERFAGTKDQRDPYTALCGFDEWWKHDDILTRAEALGFVTGGVR